MHRCREPFPTLGDVRFWCFAGEKPPSAKRFRLRPVEAGEEPGCDVLTHVAMTGDEAQQREGAIWTF